MSYHITPGQNGYTTDAGRKIKAICGKARRVEKAEKQSKEAEIFCEQYLNDHPEIVPLTGYEVANPHLQER